MNKRAFLSNMNSLRGVAIFSIMTVHLWFVPQDSVETTSIYLKLISVTREILFHDSTIFFIFISGFLFEYLSSRYSSQEYYKSKFKNILLPYLILSTGILIYNFLLKEVSFTFSDLLNTLTFGEAQFQYWYIPFICLVFLISPLLLKIPDDKLTLILPILILLPMLGTRTGTTISLGQYVYFLPIYITGMIFSINYERVILVLEKRFLLLFVAIVISTCLIILAKLFDLSFSFISLYESFHYIQKMFILLFLIVFFKKIEHIDIKILNVLAKYSFALFFTHTLVDSLVRDKFYDLFATSSFIIIPISIFYTLMIISITLLFCMSIKKLFIGHSRYVIGV
jgi:surface polysaccharide O-acyltransferase-like enzyme